MKTVCKGIKKLLNEQVLLNKYMFCAIFLDFPHYDYIKFSYFCRIVNIVMEKTY